MRTGRSSGLIEDSHIGAVGGAGYLEAAGSFPPSAVSNLSATRQHGASQGLMNGPIAATPATAVCGL
jgi:hypothetical protein